MVHYNLNNKHYQKSKNLTPEQFKEIYKANNPLEFCLTQIFKKEINELSQMEILIAEDKKKISEDNPENSNPTSLFEPIFLLMKKSLQNKVDEYIEEMYKRRDNSLKKINLK